MKNQGNQHVTSVTSRFNRLTPIAWACGSLLLGMGQAQAQVVTYATPVFAAVGSYDKTECVADTANNLIWEGKTATGTRAGTNKYSNYDDATQGQYTSDGILYTVPTISQINAPTNSIGYVKTVNDLSLCGYSDWRMPTKDELKTLIKTGSSPAIDTTWFPNTPATYAWSGSPYAFNASDAWSLYFGRGSSTSVNGRNGSYGVRLVRGGQSSATLTAQTISFGTAPSLQAGGATGTVTATASSNLAVTYSSSTTSICTVDSSTGVVTPIAAGTCTIVANQAGNATYSAATQVTQNITVNIAPPSRYAPVLNIAVVAPYDKTECVKDTQTGLIWEGKTADGGLRDGSKKYLLGYGSTLTNLVNAVNTDKLCGFSDWRMPTIDELKTLIKAGSSPTIDTTWFPNTPASYVWSGSSDTPTANWFVDFSNGTSGSYPTYAQYGVRLVRGDQSSTPPAASSPSTPTPPVTPQAVNNGVIGNTVGSGAEVLQVCQTTLYAGSNGATVQATGTNGVVDVAVQNGSVNIPCPAANPFCTTAQNQVTALTDETVRFGSNCEVTQLQISPPTPQTIPARLNGKPLIDSVIAVIQSQAPAIGAETVRKANDWNALGLGFTIGKVSVATQYPMQVNPTLPDSAKILPNGTVQVVTQGVIVNLVPVLSDVSRFTTELESKLPTAQIRSNPDGTVVVAHNQKLYALRPNLLITDENTAGFTVDGNGNLRFGNQGIPPAAYNFDQFAAILKNVAPTATVQVQTDGKLAVTLQGMTYILTPDYLVLASPTAGGTTGFEIRDGKLFTNYPFGFSQGFAVGK